MIQHEYLSLSKVWFPELGRSLEEGMATHSSSLAWRIPMDRGAWQATAHRVTRVRHNWLTQYSTHSSWDQILGFPGGSAGKEFTWSVGGLNSIPGLGRSPGEGNSYLLQYSDLQYSMDCIVHGVTKSQTRLTDFHFTSLQTLIFIF